MNSPPAYVIIGHGKERKVKGHDDLKHRLDNEQLSFLVKSGEIADHDVIEIVRRLSSDLNAYRDFSKKNGEYIDIDVLYDPEVKLGGLYLMYRGKIQDILTLEDGGKTVSELVKHAVDEHMNIMETFLKDKHFPKKYPIPEIRIWCLTCRAPFHKKDQERRREPVHEYEEESWHNNDAGVDFNRARERWERGDGNEPYDLNANELLKLPINNHGNNGTGAAELYGGVRKSKKKKKTKKRI